MASLQCHKSTEKGLNQGYHGGRSMGNWGFKKDNKYQGPQNGYAMAYSEGECYSQFHNPTHGMSKPQKAYGMAETWDESGHNPTHGMSKSQKAYGMAESWDEYGQSHDSYQSQNGNGMPKPKVHGRGNGFGSHLNNGTAHMQSYGFINNTSPGKLEGRGYGYGVPNPGPRCPNNSGRMGHGFSNHRNYEITEAYSYDEANDCWEYANNGTARSQPHHRGKHSGHEKGFIRTQAYGPGKNMGFELTEAETCEYSETHFSNEPRYYGGVPGYHGGNDHLVKGVPRKMKDGNSVNNSSSDSESDNEDEDYGFRKVWISKAI